MTIKTTVACVLVFGVGMLLFVSAKNSMTPVTARPFVVTYLVSKVSADGTKNPIGLTIRAVTTTGEWKETRYGFDGNTTIWAATADAQYSMKPGENSRQYRSTYSLEKETYFHSTSFLKNHPQYTRTENIAGLTTYVLRGGDADHYMETYYAPRCGATPLKVVMHKPDGETTIEAITVEFRDVSDQEARLPESPSRFDQAEQKVEVLKINGLTNQADGLSEWIKQAKSKVNNQ